MNLYHVAVCGALVAALEFSAASGAEARQSGADELWQIPQAPVSPRDTALGNTASDPRRDSVEAPRTGGNPALGRWFSHAPNDGSSTGPSVAVPLAPATGSASKSPQVTWNQRVAQWRLARIEKVRGQLLKQTGGVASADATGRLDTSVQPASPVRASQADNLQAPQVEYGASPERNAPAPPSLPASAAPKANDPSHEVNIELPDETEGPKPKGSLTSRLRGGR